MIHKRRKFSFFRHFLLPFLGAILGALIGAAFWAFICIRFDLISTFAGVIVGALAGLGYNLCQGRPGWGKVLCLSVAIVVGVTLGTLASANWDIHTQYEENYAQQIAAAVPGVPTEEEYFRRAISQDSVRRPFLYNLLMGLAFAFIGCYSLLRDAVYSIRSAFISAGAPSSSEAVPEPAPTPQPRQSAAPVVPYRRIPKDDP